MTVKHPGMVSSIFWQKLKIGKHSHQAALSLSLSLACRKKFKNREMLNMPKLRGEADMHANSQDESSKKFEDELREIQSTISKITKQIKELEEVVNTPAGSAICLKILTRQVVQSPFTSQVISLFFSVFLEEASPARHFCNPEFEQFPSTRFERGHKPSSLSHSRTTSGNNVRQHVTEVCEKIADRGVTITHKSNLSPKGDGRVVEGQS